MSNIFDSPPIGDAGVSTKCCKCGSESVISQNEMRHIYDKSFYIRHRQMPRDESDFGRITDVLSSPATHVCTNCKMWWVL